MSKKKGGKRKKAGAKRKKVGATGGNWPIGDVMMISDYPSPEHAAKKSDVTINACNDYLRIHMDVPYGQNDKILEKIQTGALHDAYTAIINYNDDHQPHPRAYALLAAALGLFDGVPIPTPK